MTPHPYGAAAAAERSEASERASAPDRLGSTAEIASTPGHRPTKTAPRTTTTNHHNQHPNTHTSPLTNTTTTTITNHHQQPQQTPTFDTHAYCQRRDQRHDLRSGIARFSTLDRLRTCGHHRTATRVAVKLNAGIAHYAGVATCGLIWACPRCSAKVREQRAVEIEQGVSKHLLGGGGCVMLTATVPHDQGQALVDVWGTVRDAWRKVWSGRGANDLRTELSIVGTIRVTEVTTGAAGWHPHVHALVLTEAPLTEEQSRRLWFFLFNRWQRYVVAGGWGEPSARNGIDYEPVELVNGSTALGRYLNKVRAEDAPTWNVGREIARSDVKRSRVVENLAPFQLAAFAVETGESWAIARWHEWERGSRGRRAIFWSRGLRARLGLGDEVPDEEIAAEEIGGEVVATLDGRTFDWLVRHGLMVEGLRLVEMAGASAAQAVLGALLWSAGAPRRICRGVGPPEDVNGPVAT